MKVFLLFFLISLESLAFPYVLYKENGRVGLKNESGKVVIPADYDDLGWSNGEFSIVSNVTGYRLGKAWGLISVQNQRISKPFYEELTPGDQSIIIAKRKEKNAIQGYYGAVLPSGKEAIPFLYDGLSITSFRAIVFSKIGNQFKYGLIDLTNKTLIPQQFQDIRSVGSLRFAVRNFEGKMALFTENGKQITEFVIDSIAPFEKNYAILYEGKYRGAIDRNGQVKLPSKFREIIIEGDGAVLAREPDQWHFMNGQNKILKSIKADSLSVISEGLYKVEVAKQVEITNQNFQSIIQGVFDGIGSFIQGRALYQLKGLTGVILQDGTVILPALYLEVRLGDDFIIAKSRQGASESWSLFDSSGARKTTKTYQDIVPLSSNLFSVKSKGLYGLIDSNGNELISAIYDSLVQFRDNYISVRFHKLYGVIDMNGKWIVTPKQNRLYLLGSNRFLEYSPTSVVLKSMDGNVIYFTSNPFQIHENFLLETVSDGSIWKIDFSGLIVDRQVRPMEPTEAIYEESEGLRAIKRNGRYGFIDSRGRLRIANRYEAVKPFREGLAAVKILGKWGFINMQDNIAVQPVYEDVSAFESGRAFVRQKGLFGLIDKQGKLIMSARHEAISVLPTGNILFTLNGLKGLADATGKTMITARYDELVDTGTEYVIARKDKKYGVISLQGLNTIPMVYDLIRYDPAEKIFIVMEKAQWKQF